MRAVLDSSAWIECLTKGPGAPHFSPILARAEELFVPAICITEVTRWLLRVRGRDDALLAAAIMRQARVVPLDADIAVAAAELGFAHGLPLADSLIYATARLRDATLWTQDDHFNDLPKVKYYPKLSA